MSHIYKKHLYNKKLKRKVDLNDGFYKGYFSKEGKGLYKVDNKCRDKDYFQKYMNRRYRRKKIDLEEVGYKGNYFKKGRYDIQWIIY